MAHKKSQQLQRFAGIYEQKRQASCGVFSETQWLQWIAGYYEQKTPS